VSVSTDPRYRPLASTAIAAMGAQASSSMVAAIVSQWQCEQPANAWPPRRNNPGNLARGWAAAVGIPFTVEFPNPQPSNPIVTYASAGDGARAYGTGIRSFSRYSSALAYARGGDGARFLRALLVGTGYGTSYSCAASVFARLGGQAAGGDVIPASTTGSGTLASYSPDHILTQADLDLLYKSAKDSYAQGNPLAEWQWDNMPELGPALRSKLQAYLGKPISSLPKEIGLGALNPLDAIGQVAGAIAGIPAAIGNVLAHLGELAIIGGLLLMGLWLVATSSDEG
jgi:hypothetical protein